VITDHIHKVYFLGIGGIGMSALSRYFKWKGKDVAGYDKTRTSLTQQLEAEGIQVTYEDSLDTLVKDADLVIWTPAIPKANIQYNYYLQSGIKMFKRSAVLGMVANGMYNISIAGSHGKTSTASITSYLLQQSGKDVAAFLGGICLNYESNFLPGNSIAVAEADEFDRSFLQLHPDIALITAVDTDHLDIYGSFENIFSAFSDFTKGIRTGGVLILNKGVPATVNQSSARVITYSLADTSADYYAENLSAEEGIYQFDLVMPDSKIQHLKTGYGGRHNVENAIGAIAVARQLGVEEEDIRQALMTFKGVRRRFETHIRTASFVYIDDYAHHPREIEVTLSAARELYPGRHITAVFQPHLFSRTRDLADDFAAILSTADRVILLDIYPAREEPIPGVTSALIYDKIAGAEKFMAHKNDLLSLLQKQVPDVLLTIGAGDIDTLTEEIVHRYSTVVA